MYGFRVIYIVRRVLIHLFYNKLYFDYKNITASVKWRSEDERLKHYFLKLHEVIKIVKSATPAI